jgi:putative peptidoglycan lipid II flippase
VFAEGKSVPADETSFPTNADGRQIARAAGLVMVLFVLSRLLGLIREMIIGAQFGTSADLDAYLAAFRLPDLLFQLVAGGALASAFIPTFTEYLARDDREGAWRLFSGVANLVLAITAAIAVVAALAAPWLVRRVIAPGFDPAQQALTARLMRLMLVSPILFGVSGLVMGVLNAHQHFLLPAAAPMVYNLAIIGGALGLSPRLGVTGLALGVVGGSALHFLVQVPGLIRFGARYRPVLSARDPGVRQVLRLMGPRVLGLAAVQINFLLNTILASGLPEGSLSALNFAWLMMLLPQGVFAQAVATAAFPTLAAQAARQQIGELRSTFVATLRAVLFLSLPAAVGLLVLRRPLIQVFFQRGAFEAGSTDAVAWALQFYALGLPAHAGIEIVARAFYALHDTRTPVVIGIAAMGLNVVLSLLFIGPLAHGGLALANTIATTLELLGMLALIRRRIGGLEEERTLRALGRMALSAALMGAALWAALAAMAHVTVPVQAAGGILLGLGIYGGSLWGLGAQEMRAVRHLLKR